MSYDSTEKLHEPSESKLLESRAHMQPDPIPTPRVVLPFRFASNVLEQYYDHACYHVSRGA